MTNKKSRNASTPITFKVLNEITRKLDEFTPRQRMLAEYILQHPENLAFFPITDLAAKAGVSEATIVRFSYALGYEGYPQLSREAQQAIQFELGAAGRFQLVMRRHSESLKKKPTSSFERVLKYAAEAGRGKSRNPAAVFTAILKKELGYKVVDIEDPLIKLAIFFFFSNRPK